MAVYLEPPVTEYAFMTYFDIVHLTVIRQTV